MPKTYFFPEGTQLQTVGGETFKVKTDAVEQPGGDRVSGIISGVGRGGIAYSGPVEISVLRLLDREKYVVSDNELTVNGVAGVSVLQIVNLCAGCPAADWGDVMQLNTRQQVLGCQFENKHWCDHPGERARQAKNARDGFCQSTGRKSVR